MAMRTTKPPNTAAMRTVGEMRAAQAISPAAASRFRTMIAMAKALVYAPSARQMRALKAMSTAPRGRAWRARSRAMSSSGASVVDWSTTAHLPRGHVELGFVLLHAALVVPP